jgi:hypothetical protein
VVEPLPDAGLGGAPNRDGVGAGEGTVDEFALFAPDAHGLATGLISRGFDAAAAKKFGIPLAVVAGATGVGATETAAAKRDGVCAVATAGAGVVLDLNENGNATGGSSNLELGALKVGAGLPYNNKLKSVTFQI